MKSRFFLERLQNSNLAHLGIKSPFTIPSGIITTVPSVIARLARDVPQIGFLTTKTLSVAPREGYREPVLHEYYPGCFVNAVGLANPGAQSFLEAMKSLLPLHDGKPLVVSIMGADAEEFLECARILAPIADAFELNLSCPHVQGAGQCVGSDPDSVSSIVRLMKKHVEKPIIPKLSPNLGDIAGMARLCEIAGADALSLINTVGPGIAVDSEGYPVLSNTTGGLSGAGILPVGIKAVREAASAVSLPIIASGGISSAREVRAYYTAGAGLFAVGSALAGMTTSRIEGFFDTLIHELESEKEEVFGPPEKAGHCRTDYFRTTVVENIPVGAGIFMLRLEDGSACEPGRFFFLRLSGVGEKPFSPLQDLEPIYLVRNVGPFTAALESLKPGDTIYMRGPYGKGFPAPEADEPLVLVGGGTGVAPIIMAASLRGNIAKAFFGFSGDITEPFRREILNRIPGSKIVSDPPGTVGEVVRVLRADMAADPGVYSHCAAFVCGPRPMMKAVVEALGERLPDGSIYLAREDVMRCGIGVCGSCGTETGLRSCVDGPVMRDVGPDQFQVPSGLTQKVMQSSDNGAISK
ncbi:MAG TPA: tRNA-dihydrouridine synthase [Desulfomonilaceae bacterium]|nr:tRNA-dihydrouridine synthase [Desulfomonilaceae bacterium]